MPRGRTLHDHAEERRIATTLVRQQRPTIIQELEQGATTVKAALQYLGQGQLQADIEHLSHLAPRVISAGWQRTSAQLQRAQQTLQQQAGADAGPLRLAARTAQLLDARLHPGGRGGVVQLDDRGRVMTTPPPNARPSHALELPRHEANIPRLLTLGYAVQKQQEQLIIWRVRESPPSSARVSHQSQRKHASAPESRVHLAPDSDSLHDQAAERERLIQAGAVLAKTHAPAAPARHDNTGRPSTPPTHATHAAPQVSAAAAGAHDQRPPAEDKHA